MEGTEVKMGKAEFITRFVLWITCALIVPFTYVAIEYGIFKNKEATKALSGWGIVALIVVGIVAISVFAEIRKALPRHNMFRQCIDGAMGLVPLLLLILAIDAVKDNLEAFERFLIVTFACEAVAVPINPMRKWRAAYNIDEGKNAIKSLFEWFRGNKNGE